MISLEEEKILNYWRKYYKLPFRLTREEVYRFWQIECKPYITRVEAVKKFKHRFDLNILIETGTYHGAMVEAMLNNFDEIISIELDEKLYKAARDKFSKYSQVDIIHGDSAEVLPKILQSLSKPCIFWLDGHYIPNSTESARGDVDTPIMDELNHILNHHIKDHVILIDDARCFIGPNPVLNNYPTIQELKDFVIAINPKLQIDIMDDIIRIHPMKAINK